MCTSFNGVHEEQSLPVAETNDTDMDTDVVITGNKNILDEPETSAPNLKTTISCSVVSDSMITKSDETPSHIKPIPVTLPSLTEQDKHTTPGTWLHESSDYVTYLGLPLNLATCMLKIVNKIFCILHSHNLLLATWLLYSINQKHR